MDHRLPSRPDLDHLRRQAKSLLAQLTAGDAGALRLMQEHLPACKDIDAQQVRQMRFRLADAQSAIARKTGFASWPRLARHVEQLRALEGTWSFVSLEVDGSTLPAAGLRASHVRIDGDCFRTESPEATYEGVFHIDVEAEPHRIDIEFVAGPEAGNWNRGIFRLDGDRLEICLDVNGKPHPTAFRAPRGSGWACEVLSRTSPARPTNVSGGTAAAAPTAPARTDVVPDGFAPHDSPTLARLQGEWSAQAVVRDGQELPAMMLPSGRRTARQNQVEIAFGGQVMIRALVRLHEGTDPLQIDYYNLHGPAKGQLQHGILEWHGDEVTFCMAAPGDARPTDFACAPGSARTLSRWRPRHR